MFSVFHLSHFLFPKMHNVHEQCGAAEQIVHG